MKNEILKDIYDYHTDHPMSKYSYLIRGSVLGLESEDIKQAISELQDDGFIGDDGIYAKITEAGITEAEGL